jgi:hypothetical protein
VWLPPGQQGQTLGWAGSSVYPTLGGSGFRAALTLLLPHIGFETVRAMLAEADIAQRHLEDFLGAVQPGDAGS